MRRLIDKTLYIPSKLSQRNPNFVVEDLGSLKILLGEKMWTILTQLHVEMGSPLSGEEDKLRYLALG